MEPIEYVVNKLKWFLCLLLLCSFVWYLIYWLNLLLILHYKVLRYKGC